jgi:hypothetical protein
MESILDSTPEIPVGAPTLRAGNGRGKLRLLTRSSLDGRTKARKQFDAIAEGIAADLQAELRGEGKLSTIQRHLIEAFAATCVVLQSLNARLLLGEEVDLTDQSQAVSALVRLASRLGIRPVPLDEVLTLGGMLRADIEQQQQQQRRRRQAEHDEQP